jgi:predicted ester cyclase
MHVDSPSHWKEDVMSAQTNKSILRTAAEAFNRHESGSGWFEIHDPSVIAHGLGPEPLDFEGLKRFYGGLWRAFPDLQITVEDMIAEGDEVAWRLRVTGTHKAEFVGIPPTGTRVTFAAQYIFRFRNGLIVERWTNLDRLGVLVQLGAIQVPA